MIPISSLAGILESPSPSATALFLTAPTPSSGYVGTASSVFQVGFGAGVPLTSPVFVTLSDAGAGGVFAPTSLSLSQGSPTGTFTYTPSAQGIKTISIANNGGLANPSAVSFTVGPTLPSWRTSMTPRTWRTIPATNKLSQIDPTTNPLITPSGADWATRGMTLGLFSWTGACFSEDTGYFWIPVGGGHHDYGGNEPYKIDLLSESPTWSMVRPPTGALPGPNVVTIDGMEATGLYADGRIRAQHTYNNAAYIPGVGPALGRMTAFHYSAVGNVFKSYTINPTTGEASLLSDYSSFTGLGNGEGGTAYDSSRNCLWVLGSATSTLVQVDVATGTATKRGVQANWITTSGSLTYIPTLDVLVEYPASNSVDDIAIRNLSTFTSTHPTITGSWSQGFQYTVSSDGFGISWCQQLGCLLLWNNKTNMKEISTLTPTGTATDPWVKGVLAVDPSNTVIPTVATAVGTFNRFIYSPRLKGCILLNGTTEDIYFFATE